MLELKSDRNREEPFESRLALFRLRLVRLSPRPPGCPGNPRPAPGSRLVFRFNRSDLWMPPADPDDCAPGMHHREGARFVLGYLMGCFLFAAICAIVFRIYLIGAIIKGAGKLPWIGKYVRLKENDVRATEDLLFVV